MLGLRMLYFFLIVLGLVIELRVWAIVLLGLQVESMRDDVVYKGWPGKGKREGNVCFILLKYLCKVGFKVLC